MSKPNIVFLHSHNTGRHIQPYGFAVPTPHLQKLAQQGVIFRRAFAAAPTCSPSRAAFLTGQCPHSAGMLGLAHRGFGLRDIGQHIVHTLKPAGYHTLLAGIEHTTPHRDATAQVVGYDQVLEVGNGAAAKVGPAVSAWLRDRAADRSGRPFFISAGLQETHIPFPAPDPVNHPAEDERYCVPPPPLPDVPQIRRDTAAFKASARAMDDCFGQILTALDSSGLAENTLVFCFADHGLQFSRHMCNLTDAGLEVYLIARGPSQGPAASLRGGKVIEAMVSLLDLFPSSCAAAQLEQPAWLQGKSLLPLVEGQVETLHEELFGEVTFHAAPEPMRSVRTTRYKYIRRYDQRDRLVLPNADDTASKEYLLQQGWADQPRHQEMLFDLVFDPHEANNLIADPRLTAVAADLKTRLQRWMTQTADPLLTAPATAPVGTKYNDPNGQSWLQPAQVVPEGPGIQFGVAHQP